MWKAYGKQLVNNGKLIATFVEEEHARVFAQMAETFDALTLTDEVQRAILRRLHAQERLTPDMIAELYDLEQDGLIMTVVDGHMTRIVLTGKGLKAIES